MLAETRFALAPVLWSAPAGRRERAHARQLAAQALVAYEDAGEDTADIRAWLIARPTP